MMLTIIFLITILSGLITYALTPFMIFLAHRLELLDDPGKRPHPAHTHTGVIPRGGGLPIYFGIFFPILVFFPLDEKLIGIIIGATLLILIGLWDDKKSRSPYIRFLTNIVAAGIVIGSGIGIPYITNPLGGIIHLDTVIFRIPFLAGFPVVVWSDLFAFVWILWTTNIIGWSGGVDGQMPGFVAISAIVLGILSLRFAGQDPSQLFVVYLSFITAGAFLGFLPWNFYPQKIMPGYAGKTLAGFMLGILSILAFGKLGTALLVLAIPMTDAVFVLVKRVYQGHSPVWATSEHLHHHLLKLGWSKRKVAIFYWIVSGVTGIAALTLSSQQKAFAFLLVLVIVSGVIVWVNTIRKTIPPK